MSRPVTLFTGQWADLTLEELAEKCGAWGFDGLELACWGDHFDVPEAITSSARRCATRSTRGTRRCCHPMCGATAIPRGSGSARPT